MSEEEQVYEAVMAWVKGDLSLRECLLPDLLNCLRLFSMSKYSLRRIANTEELITNSLMCSKILNNGLDFFLFPDRFLGTPLKHRISIEKEDLVVILTGGESNDGLCEETDCFSLATMKWHSLCQIPRSCLSEECVDYVSTVCGGRLYGMDGKSTRVGCFNPYDNSWTPKKTMLSSLRGSTLTSHKEEIYLIGGMYYSDRMDDVTVLEMHKFNPICNEWKQLHVSSMETSRACHCAVVLEDLIYVIAGYDGEDCLKSVERYNPTTDQWKRSASLKNGRKSAASISVGGKMFVVGGFANANETDFKPSCEMFDQCLNQWCLVSSPSVLRAECGIVCVDETVYVFGGENEHDYLDSVECYDAGCNEWKQMDISMPVERTRVQASLLKLPKRFLSNTVQALNV